MTTPAVFVKVQNLQTIPYTPAANVLAGNLIVDGDIVGIAQTNIAMNVQGNLIVGTNYVWSGPKATTGGSGAALAFWTPVYFDTTNQIVSPNPEVGPFLGYAVSQPTPTDAQADVWVLFRPQRAEVDSVSQPTYGAAITIDVTKETTIIAASNTTAAAATLTPSGPGNPGDEVTILTETDASGTVTATFASTFHSSGTQATTASKFSSITFRSDGSRWIEKSRTTALS